MQMFLFRSTKCYVNMQTGKREKAEYASEIGDYMRNVKRMKINEIL